ncbi:MAG TPA: EamA family transporter RarD [Xanthomonadales bacterium]|nr:EamA family transporter RarD [Xanthomonadales bacterium]
MNQNEKSQRRAIAAALAAFFFWGLAPIYFKWMILVPPLEIIAHRILWSIPVLAGFLLLRDGPGFWRRMVLPRRTIAVLFVSGTLVVSNWLLFVWAVNTGQILATSLGYFINPLLNVLLGFIFLHERLTPAQTAAVGLAAAGTVYLTWFFGFAPWISLAMALTFGLYGLVRKKLAVGPMVGLLWETLLLAAPAWVYLLWAMQHGGIAFGHVSGRMDLLLALAGLVTVLPLVWFNTAARSMPLSTLGFFQYTSPTITFLLAVFLYDEPFTQGHAVAFICIWLALALVSAESLLRARRMKTR